MKNQWQAITVEFELTENNSGATLDLYSAVTDSAGQVTVIYHAGGSDPHRMSYRRK